MTQSDTNFVQRWTRLAVAVGCWAAVLAVPASGQEMGGLDSLVTGYLTSDPATASVRADRQVMPDLGLLLERQLIAGQPLEANYYTLGGFWVRNRNQGLAALWRQNNVVFLAQPVAQRTGEGLIPDIQVPLPVLGKILGSGAEIKLNGLYKFTLGGQQTVYPNNKAAYALGQTGSNFDLKIKQDYKVDLEGVVGERVHVLIDYDSQIEIEKKSKVRLRYEGKEDEILQKLEAGDTEFSITGSSLVGGLSTVHKGLFGIKAEAKLAGLELTAIASKEEGQSQSNSYTGESSSQSLPIDDVSYMKHRFFTLPFLKQGDSLLAVRVYVRQQIVGSQPNLRSVNGIDRSWLYFAGLGKESVTPNIQVEEKFSPEFFTFSDPVRPSYLYLRQSLDPSADLGVVCQVKKGNDSIQWIPDSTVLSGTSPFNILLLKPANCNPPDGLGLNGYAWNYELRNFYDLRSRQITNLTIKLQKKTSGNDFLDNDSTSKHSYLYLSGLDPDSNGIIDPLYVRLGEDGFFFTPDEKPFVNVMPDSNPDLYRTVNVEQVQSKYRFLASYLSSDVSYRFLASAGRIIDGSVKVYLNGSLIPASDYRVDYDIGELEFTNEDTKQRVKQANAQLRIDYQYLPTFALGSKTLVGVRGVYKFSDKAVLGGTWLYRSEQTPEDRPRLGEEPRRIIVAGLDGSVEVNPEFLTRAIDALPLVETEAQSSIKLAGEFAANFPNPNTKGQVYVDDMDGAKQSDGLVMDRRYWAHSSAPPRKLDSLYADQCYWYNPTVRPIQGEINPDMTDDNARKDPVSTMRLHVQPRHNDTASWGGITTVVSRSGLDFTERKILNVWVKGNAGRLHVDLGQEISEDQVRRRRSGPNEGLLPANGRYDSEKLAPDGSQTYTDATDTGLDSIRGTDGDLMPGDDGNDDFVGTDSTRVNGTERNGQFDSEDLTLSKRVRPGDTLLPKNNYFTFRFSLSDGNANAYGWHKYSVPLENAGIEGSPYNWNNITYARIWVDSLTQAADVELALVEVSGNQWLEQRIAKQDTLDSLAIDPREKFTIGVKNNRDDADYSSNPPYDPGKDENGNVKFEQSLSFNIYDLGPGHMAVARKSLRDRENDYRGYRRLRLYVKGESGNSFLVRLVATNDSNSYYQYSAPTNGVWQDVVIELDHLAALKKSPYNGSRDDGAYSVRGSPNLTNLSRIQLGVINGRTQPYTGQVWFDDLRLDDVRRDRGTALRSVIDIRMADLLSLAGSYNQIGSHWYTMNDLNRGSGIKSVNYSISGSLALSRFYLDRIGFNLPLSFSQSVNEGYFEFGNDDIRLTEAESKTQRSWDRNRTAGFTLARTKPSGWWLTGLTVDRLSYSASWRQSDGFSRSTADSATGLTQGLNYAWTPSRNQGVSVFKLTRFYYLPSSVSSSWNSSQTRQWHLDKLTAVQNTNGSGRARSLTGSLGWKLIDQLNYTFSQNRDLMQKQWQGDPKKIDGWLIHRLGLGSEINRSQRVEFNTTLSWLKLIKPAVNYSTTYNEQHTVVLSADRLDSTNVQNATNANALTLSNDFAVGTWLAKLTALRNANKDTAAEVGSPRWMLIRIDDLFRSWSGVQVSFTQNKSNAASGLTKRPTLWYQLGWEREPKGIARYGQTAADNGSLSNAYSANSQARFGPVNLTGSWGRSDNWTTSGPVTTYGRTVNWPNLRADIMSVEKVWPQAWTSSRLASSYIQTEERNFQQDRGLSRAARRRNFSPLAEWSCTWKPRFSTTLNYDLSTQDIQEPGDTRQYPSGWRSDYSETKKVSGSFSYALTAQKGLALNLWKLGRRRFKFSNELRVSLSGSYSVRTQQIFDAQSARSDAQFMANTEELTVSSQAEYRFSNSITGSLSADYGSSTNKISSVSDSKRYGLNLLVNVVF